MSRGGAQKQPSAGPKAVGTPIWVWIVYALGILAGAIFAFSILFTAGALLLAEDVPTTYDVQLPALLVWGALAVLAAVVWIRRRRR